jgi:hypothetical protein
MHKLLHRERYIQMGGVLLLLAPLFNLVMSIALDSPLPNRWSPASLLIFIKSIKTSSWILHGLSILVGSMMLKGRRSSWILVLLVLGTYIVMNGLYFKQQARSGLAQPVLSLLINVGLFFIVYMQEFHQRLYGMPGERKQAPSRAQPTSMRPQNLTPQSNPQSNPQTTPRSNPVLHVDFIGIGPWAHVTNITSSEIRMQSLSPAFPQGIERRTVELILASGKTVRAKFVKRSGDEYTFRYLQEAPHELTRRWAA